MASAIELESSWDGGSQQNTSAGADYYNFNEASNTPRELKLDAEILDEIEAQRAQLEERQKIQDILERKPRRWQNGFWREMWSFVIVQREKA